jgi:hypothetical protein
LQRELQGLIESQRGAIPAAAVAAAFEQCASLLPENSALLPQVEQLARGLRHRTAAYIGEEALRRVVTSLRQSSDRIGAGIEARDKRLRQKR